MTLPTRLREQAARREAVLDAIGDPETRAMAAQDVVDLREAAKAGEWRPTSEAPTEPGTYINVRTVTSYRWLAYKKDGARQMGKPGRWQRATEYGWENAPLPEGEFVLNPPTPPVTP